MDFVPTAIPEVVVLRPDRHHDDRGFFSETFRAEWFPDLVFVQDNHSYSARANTIRGLHAQTPPTAQTKLVRAGAGRVRSVAVDLRTDSPTFLDSVTVLLSEDTGDQLLVPQGFAHGFVTLEPDAVVLYKTTTYHSPEDEIGIRWDDPVLGVEWGFTGEPILSPRDAGHPPFDPAHSPFVFGPG